MRRVWGLALIGLLVALTATALAQVPARPVTPAARIETGRKVYEREKCAACHEMAGKGNSRFPLDGVGSRLTAAQLRRWITDTARMEDALPRMPAVRMSATKFRLKSSDLDALVAYLQSLKPGARVLELHRSKL